MRFGHWKNSASAIGKSESSCKISLGQGLSSKEFERLVMWFIKNCTVACHQDARI
jgi:hypothetical protein